MKIKLECSHDDWHGLASAIDATRESSTTVKVDKGALDRLMRDHSKMVDMKKGELIGAT